MSLRAVAWTLYLTSISGSALISSFRGVGRIWETAGRPSEAESKATKTGSSSNCTSQLSHDPTRDSCCSRGAPGNLEQVEIDTAHFKGNFPESCELHGLFSEGNINWKTQREDELDWTLILPRTRLGPHRQHYFQLENVEGKTFTHVRVTIHPDGGLKRVRIVGQLANVSTTMTEPSATTGGGDGSLVSRTITTDPRPVDPSPVTITPVLPLTPEAFAPFGQVIQAYGDHAAVPKGTRITPANAGTASKFHKLSLLESLYPSDKQAGAGISVYRCQPLTGIATDGTVELTTLERHPFTNQGFIPMGRGAGEGLNETADKYLVVVAKNGEDDRPDLKTVRAFVATTAQGIVYNTAVWRELNTFFFDFVGVILMRNAWQINR